MREFISSRMVVDRSPSVLGVDLFAVLSFEYLAATGSDLISTMDQPGEPI